MELTEGDTCPSCGSGTLTLQGRILSGKPIRELVCISCKHAWRIEPPSKGRPRT